MKRRKEDVNKKTNKMIEERQEVVKEHVPVPRVRPTAWDTKGSRPPYWPTTVNVFNIFKN